MHDLRIPGLQLRKIAGLQDRIAGSPTAHCCAPVCFILNRRTCRCLWFAGTCRVGVECRVDSGETAHKLSGGPIKFSVSAPKRVNKSRHASRPGQKGTKDTSLKRGNGKLTSSKRRDRSKCAAAAGKNGRETAPPHCLTFHSAGKKSANVTCWARFQRLDKANAERPAKPNVGQLQNIPASRAEHAEHADQSEAHAHTHTQQHATMGRVHGMRWA